ncbi:hypothetical protein BDZ45DRAFT_606756, partial [Acephala macrosclerotiorum]
GPITGEIKTYSVVDETASKVTFIASFMSLVTMDTVPLDRYLAQVDKHTGSLLSSDPASISYAELEAMFLEAEIGQINRSERFKDGAFSVSYRVFCEKKSYVVQLRSNGNVSTIYAIHQLIKQKYPDAIPVAQLYKTTVVPSCNLPVQISAFVPGVMADVAYPQFGPREKERILKRIAHAFDAIWSLIPLPANSQIGEALIDPNTDAVSVGPDRRYQLGGPFQSVSSYLESWIRRRVLMLQEQGGVEEFKSKYLDRILQFTATMPSSIPECVNQVPVVLTHADMGLHNMILNSDPPHDLSAIIDWEFVYCYPFPFSVSQIIEPILSENSAVDTVSEPEITQQLRTAFWDEIPKWRDLLSQEACQEFIAFYEFGMLLKVEAVRGAGVDVEAKWRSWSRSCNVVDTFLDKYGSSSSNL